MEINNNIEYFEQLSNYLPELKNKSCLIFDADSNELKQFTQVTNQVTVLKDPKDLDSLNQKYR